MATVVLALTWAFAVQSFARATLDELIAHPDRYAGKVVEVRAVFVVTEEPVYLCSDRLDPEEPKGCEPVATVMARDASQAERDKYLAAMSLGLAGKHNVWLTVRGHFEASDRPAYGWQKSCRYRFLIEEVLRTESQKRKIKR